MLRSLMLAIPAGFIAVSFAAADTTVGYDRAIEEKFEAKRDIVEMAKRAYGPAAVEDNGQRIPASIDRNLVPRQTVPAAAPVSEVPAPLAGRLPHTEADTRWAQVGEHLIEVRPDNTIVMAVYDVLP